MNTKRMRAYTERNRTAPCKRRHDTVVTYLDGDLMEISAVAGKFQLDLSNVAYAHDCVRCGKRVWARDRLGHVVTSSPYARVVEL